MTSVILRSAPHEMQNQPQDSLQATRQRLPTEGKLRTCKQEAAESMVMAGHTNGTAGTAKPIIADIDRTATLGKDLVTVACGVNEGDEMERNKSRLQQTILYCKEDQCSGNANANVPSAYKLLLEGEWAVYPSGEISNSRNNANASNMAVECVYGPSESKKTEDAMKNELRGREGGTSERESIDAAVECCQQLCMADGDADRGVEPTGTPNESEGLVTVLDMSEEPGGSGIPRAPSRRELACRQHERSWVWNRCVGQPEGWLDRPDGRVEHVKRRWNGWYERW